MKKILLLCILNFYSMHIYLSSENSKQTQEMIAYSQFALGKESDASEKQQRREAFAAYFQQKKQDEAIAKKQEDAAKTIQKTAKKYLAKKATEKAKKINAAASIIQKSMRKHHEKVQDRTYEEFSKILNQIDYKQFRDLICSGNYLDKTDWLYQYLEIRLNLKIFKTNSDNSKDLDNFDEEFLKKITNPHDWLDEQIKHYLPKFHADCYKIFIKRAIKEIKENKMPWTQAVSIPAPKDFPGQQPGTPIYPIVYKHGDKRDFLYSDNSDSSPQVDNINLPLAEILEGIIKDTAFKQLPTIPYFLYPWIENLPVEAKSKPGVIESRIKATIFEQKASHLIKNKYFVIQGMLLTQLSNGSIITLDNTTLYYYQFNPATDIFKLKNFYQYYPIYKTLSFQFYLSNKETTLNILTSNPYDKEHLSIFSWNFESENFPEMKSTSLPLQMNPDIIKTDQFIIQYESKKNKLIIYKKDMNNPTHLIKTKFTIPYLQAMYLSATHEKTNRIAISRISIINKKEESVTIYQLHENKEPEIINLLKISKDSQTNWSPSEALFAVTSQTRRSSSITIFKTSDWSILYKYDFANEAIYNAQISSDDKYILYCCISKNSNYSYEYKIQNLEKKQLVCTIPSNNLIKWNLSSSKHKLIIQHLYHSSNFVIADLNEIYSKTIPILIQNAFLDYALSLGFSSEQKQHLKRISSKSDDDKIIEDIEFLFEKPKDQQQIDAWYGNDFAKAAHQIFLLGQILLENNLQAFDQLGGDKWVMQQPKEIQTIILNHMAIIKNQPTQKKIWQSAHDKPQTAVEKYRKQNK